MEGGGEVGNAEGLNPFGPLHGCLEGGEEKKGGKEGGWFERGRKKGEGFERGRKKGGKGGGMV